METNTVKISIVLIGLLISNIVCMGTIYDPKPSVIFSKNGKYKLKIIPKWSNELGDSIIKNPTKQCIVLFRKRNKEYDEINKIEVSEKHLYLTPNYYNNFYISNDGINIVIEDRANLEWSIIKISKNNYSYSILCNIFDIVKFNQNEYIKFVK